MAVRIKKAGADPSKMTPEQALTQAAAMLPTAGFDPKIETLVCRGLGDEDLEPCRDFILIDYIPDRCRWKIEQCVAEEVGHYVQIGFPSKDGRYNTVEASARTPWNAWTLAIVRAKQKGYLCLVGK